MKRLSIIVPVYNVAPYLTRCLNSLMDQSIDPGEYEIIIINDGSTDESGSIAGNFTEKYEHIRLIEQPNQGLGCARNTGMLHARGKYIQFVDPDDYLEPNEVSPLLDKMEKEELDILRFNYRNVNEQNEIIQPGRNSKKYVDYSDKVTNGLCFLNERLGYACYATQFIFRSDLILRKGNEFKTGFYFEDSEWTPRILLQARRVTSVNSLVYNYVLRQDSITRGASEEKKRKLQADKFRIIEALQQQMKDVDDQRWYKGMIAKIAVSILGETAENHYKEYASVLSRLKSKAIFPLSVYHMTGRQKVHLFIANLSPRIYGIIKHTIQL